MTNIASALKDEITRLARKELKGETSQLRGASARYRADIASLKREAAALRPELRRMSKQAGRQAKEADGEGARTRYSTKSLASQRRRLGLSAGGLGKLLGVSALSVYNWEAGKARPRARHLPAIAALRTLKKRDADSIVASR